MRFGETSRMLAAGIVAVGALIAATPSPSGAALAIGPANCSAAAVTFVRAVGAPAAPVLVPGSLPVQVCTVPNSNVQVVLPAVQVVGSSRSPVIVPSGLQPVQVVGAPVSPLLVLPQTLSVASCSTVVVLPAVPAVGTTLVLQPSQSGGPALVLNPAVATATTSGSSVIECF